MTTDEELMRSYADYGAEYKGIKGIFDNIKKDKRQEEMIRYYYGKLKEIEKKQFEILAVFLANRLFDLEEITKITTENLELELASIFADFFTLVLDPLITSNEAYQKDNEIDGQTSIEYSNIKKVIFNEVVADLKRRRESG